MAVATLNRGVSPRPRRRRPGERIPIDRREGDLPKGEGGSIEWPRGHCALSNLLEVLLVGCVIDGSLRIANRIGPMQIRGLPKKSSNPNKTWEP
jgi:hypothetical protein